MKIPTPQQKPQMTNGRPCISAGKQTSLPITALLALLALLALVQQAGAVTYTWQTLGGNWSTATNWAPNTSAGGPTAFDSVIFGNTAASASATTVSDVVDANFKGAVTNLTVNSIAFGTYVYDVTQIPAGQTLTVSSNVLVGGVNESTAYATFAYMVGGGTFDVTGPSLVVQNYGSASGANACAYLNMSGLANFIYHNTNGAIAMAGFVPAGYASGSSGTRQGGSMFLASASNNITASAINLGTSAVAQAGPNGSIASGVASVLTLGPGTNMINAATINIAAEKNSFTITNSGGGLRIRGLSGSNTDSSVNITIGNRNVGGGTGIIMGNMLLDGCAVDIKAGTLIVGENVGGAPSSAADGGTGVLQFDTGTVSANSVIMADNTSANNGANLAECSGTIDVGANGTLLIGAGQLFDLASETSSGTSTGTLIISNGLVNCQGPIAMGPNVGGTSSGSIVFLTGGTLNMGPNSYVGVVTNPITALTLTNCTLSVSIPSTSYTNICVNTLNWPTPDNGLTISIAAMPAGILPGAVFPLINFGTMNGTLANTVLSLPPGVQGYLSLAPGGNTIYMTITAGVGPGIGGVQQLLNPSFELTPLGTDWTTVGGASVVTSNGVSTYPNTAAACMNDTRLIQVLDGTNAAELTGSFVAGGSTNYWSQSVAVTPGAPPALAPGSTLTAGAFTYVAHEDPLSGQDSFYYEIDFLNASGALIASYESTVISNLTCGGSNIIPLDTWTLMAITNQMQVSGGLNTGTVIGNVPLGIITVPPQTATAKFKAVLVQRNATDSGSVYFDGVNMGSLTPPAPPTLSAVTPNLITFCTNTTLSGTASSTETTISSVQLITQTTALGGVTTNTTTSTLSAPYVTGLGTSAATVNFPLITNVIYLAAIVRATDANGITVAVTNTFDTLVPSLVVEASDYNFSGGQFFDTPSDGGVALYTNQVGTAGTDYQKAARAATPDYYRLSDPLVIQPAAPFDGIPPSATEQKFITAAADGDTRTNDIEMEVGYNTPGDWLNFSRTFGPGGSAPAGTYNVWCYLATGASGVMSTFSQVTSGSTQSTQTTNFLGSFGTASFSDIGYNNFVYVPLVDQFGNRVSLTISNGVQTFKNTVVGNPNIGFFLFVPVAPIYTPVLLNVDPNGTANFEATGEFTFTLSPEQGAALSTNGISLVINGQTITSGLTFTPGAGGTWTVDYPIASNQVYTAVINVTNSAGLSVTYPVSFNTFDINNYHWMAVDYDFSTNNGTGAGGSVGDGWTGGLFINNPVPTGGTNAPAAQAFQFQTNSYFGYPTAFFPAIDPAGFGAVAQQGIDINWPTNAVQDPVGGQVANSIYRGGPYPAGTSVADGVAEEVAGDTFLLPDFLASQTNFGDSAICEFNIGYFYAGNWLNYTRTYPANTYNVWGRIASADTFSGATLSRVTSGVGTSNQVTSVLGTFSDPNAAGNQVYHWIELADTNGNPVYVSLGGTATLRLTAPTNSSPSGGFLNPLFFMLAPATAPSSFEVSVYVDQPDVFIYFPTQLGHNYIVWEASSLTSPWTEVAGPMAGDGEVQFVTEPLGGSQAFFKVFVQ